MLVFRLLALGCLSLGSVSGLTLSYASAAHAETLEDLLQEVKIPTLPPRTRESLDFLVEQKGFGDQAAHEIISALQAGQTLYFRFRGGPIQETISWPIQSIGEMQSLEDRFKAQRERDEYRPNYPDAQHISQERVPQVLKHLNNQEQEALERAQLSVNQYKSLQSQLQAQQAQQQANTEALNKSKAELNVLHPAYTSARSAYYSVKSRYDQQYRDWQNAENRYQEGVRQRDRLTQRIQQLWAVVTQEEQLLWKDSTHAATHRKRAQAHRQMAQQLEQELRRLQYRLQQDHLQRLQHKNSVDITQPYYTDARRRFREEETRYEAVENVFKDLQTRQKQITTQHDKLATALQANQAEQARWLYLIPLLRSAQQDLQRFHQQLQSHQDYAAYFQSSENPNRLKRVQQLSQDTQYLQTFDSANATDNMTAARFKTQLQALLFLEAALKKPAWTAP